MSHQELAAALEAIRVQQRDLNTQSRALVEEYNAAVVVAVEAIDAQIAEQRAAITALNEQIRTSELEKRELEATLFK